MNSKFAAMEEEQIICLAQEGNSEAMTYLLEKYKETVRALARPLFLMDGDQDDLLQEGMIGLFKAIRTFDKTRKASFETFARLCISGQLYSAIKISNRQKNIPLNSYISLDAPVNQGEGAGADRSFEKNQALAAWQKNPEEIVISQENAKNIRKRLFSRLSKMEKMVLQYFLQGLTYQEIAKKMEKSPKAIDNALQRIKTKLAKLDGGNRRRHSTKKTLSPKGK